MRLCLAQSALQEEGTSEHAFRNCPQFLIAFTLCDLQDLLQIEDGFRGVVCMKVSLSHPIMDARELQSVVPLNGGRDSTILAPMPRLQAIGLDCAGGPRSARLRQSFL